MIDGGGLVTLDGMGKRRILYQDTCDQRQVWTTNHCDDQAFPQLVVQNLTFAHGNSTGNHFEGGGGGAIFDRGGQLKIVNTTFVGNRCDRIGPDLGGAAVRALSQFRGRPVYVVGSAFRGGRCSNGSGLSSIGVSWTVLNSRFVGNRATGIGANPPRSPSQPGGGSGGAIYTDGNDYRLVVAGTLMRHNHANEGGGAIFYVSNDRTGTLHIRWSTLTAQRQRAASRPARASSTSATARSTSSTRSSADQGKSSTEWRGTADRRAMTIGDYPESACE